MGRNYVLFSSFDTCDISSPKLRKEVSNFHFNVHLDPNLQVLLREEVLLEIKDITAINSIDWFGDSIKCDLKYKKYYPLSVHIFYGYGIFILKCESKLLDKKKIENLIKIKTKKIEEFLPNYTLEDNIPYITLKHAKMEKIYAKTYNGRIDTFFKDIVKIGQDWIKNIPTTNQYVNEELWDLVWVLERIGHKPTIVQNVQYNLPQKIKTDDGKKESIPSLSEILNVVEDLSWYDLELAKSYLKNGITFYYQKDTGVIKNRFWDKEKESNNYNLSSPPIWSHLVLETAKLTGKNELITDLYPILKNNIEWWEKNRYNQEYQLFGAKMNALSFEYECNHSRTPRFRKRYNGNKWEEIEEKEERDLLLIDLNAQMCDYYQNMGVLGMIFGDSNANSYFQKAQKLQERADEVLWDEKGQFYYDFDIKMNCRQPMKTITGFWPLFGGLALKSRISPLMKHLTNQEEFWSEIPIPSIALNEKKHQSQIWDGSVVISQNLWIILGLKRYNLNNIAAQLTKKIFHYLNNSYDLYQGIYHYYPPMSYNINSIKDSEGQNVNLNNYDYHHLPIHSLFYQGMLGVEVLDESINFVPDWTALDKEINFSFYYRREKYDEYLSKMDKKIVEIK